MTKAALPIERLIGLFEVVAPPILLSDESIVDIKLYTKPIPEDLVQQFLWEWEGPFDEYTEVIPCFALPKTSQYTALVYWKASLLRYDIIIVTLDKDYNLIARKVICGMIVEGQVIKQSAAKIDEDLIIHILAGATFDGAEYDPNTGQSFYMEIMETGDLLFHIDDQIITHATQ